MQVLLLITTALRCSTASLFVYWLFVFILALLCRASLLPFSSAVQSLSGTSVYCRFNWYPRPLSNTECRQCVCPELCRYASLLLRFTIAISICNSLIYIYFRWLVVFLISLVNEVPICCEEGIMCTQQKQTNNELSTTLIQSAATKRLQTSQTGRRLIKYQYM